MHLFMKKLKLEHYINYHSSLNLHLINLLDLPIVYLIHTQNF